MGSTPLMLCGTRILRGILANRLTEKQQLITDEAETNKERNRDGVNDGNNDQDFFVS
jgi:hypothetical protein